MREETMEAIVMQQEETLGQFLRRRREELGLGLREVCRLSEKNPNCGRKLSSGYYARVETEDPTVNVDKITMDFFWAVGVVLEVDPLKLFVLSRPEIPRRFLEKLQREKIFRQG